MLHIEALDRITDTAIAAAGKTLPTDTPAILLPAGIGAQSLEYLQDHRSRFRGVLTTNSLADFCQYVSEEAPFHTQVSGFIDADSMACTAFFNLGTTEEPGHADHRAKLSLKPTAAYTALQQIAGKRLAQQELAEWMEDWNDYLTVTTSQGEPLAVAAAVQKVRTITIKASAERTSTESNFGAQRSALDSIEAAHADKQPDVITFRFSPYQDLKEHDFTLRLSILTGEDKPVLKLRWVQEEAQKEAIAQEFKERLKTDLESVAALTLGNFNPGN